MDIKFYNKVWFIWLMLFLFAPVGIFLMWKNNMYGKTPRTIITVLSLFLFLLLYIAKNIEEEKLSTIQVSLENGEIDKAIPIISELKNSNDTKIKTIVSDYETMINNSRSDAYAKDVLYEMTDNDFELLQNGKLQKTYIQNKHLNSEFLILLKNTITAESIQKRKEMQQLKKKKEKKLADAEAKKIAEEKIKSQFSLWDGSHVKLKEYILKNMNDPKSFEHIETKYILQGDTIVVQTEFRGRNGFGGMVKGVTSARFDLDGKIIEILK